MKHMIPKRQVAAIVGIAILLVSIVAIAADHTSLASAPVSAAPGLAASTSAPTNPEPSPVVTTSAPATPLMSDTPGGVPADDAAYNHLVSQLEKEQYLLTLQSKNADLRKKIAESQGDASLPAPQSVIVAPPASMTPQNGVPSDPARGGGVSSITVPNATPAPVQEDLRLASVIGVGGNYQATVIDHGVDCTVHVGSTLSDGWYVNQIAPSSIELSRGRSHRVLHVGN